MCQVVSWRYSVSVNNDQLKILSKMKKLIKLGKRRFQIRRDRDYLLDLLELGISESEAWNVILELNKHFYFNDPKPSYYKNTDTLIFKKQINGVVAYIKLKIENNNNQEEIVVCISFHEDNRF